MVADGVAGSSPWLQEERQSEASRDRNVGEFLEDPCRRLKVMFGGLTQAVRLLVDLEYRLECRTARRLE